ncbi:MAG: hypothetical protein KY410_05775, partial [Proteobacteria bacterium]|nr:hypothetical protein [Pseudomonadota bacterium]
MATKSRFDDALRYEGTLAMIDGYRVIVVSLEHKDRCFPVAPNGHPLVRTGYASIDEAKERVMEFRDAGRSPDVDSLPPSALPPNRRLPLEPVMDTVMRVDIQGIYVVLLGILVGGEPVEVDELRQDAGRHLVDRHRGVEASAGHRPRCERLHRCGRGHEVAAQGGAGQVALAGDQRGDAGDVGCGHR